MIRSIYIAQRFFVAWGIVFLLFVTAFIVPFLFYVAQLALIALVLFLLADIVLLNKVKHPFIVKRTLPSRLDLGDEVRVLVSLENTTQQPFSCTLYDETPVEFQARDLSFQRTVLPHAIVELSYIYQPKTRGIHSWGKIHVFFSSQFGLVRKRIVFSVENAVPVYPSVQQMKKYEFQVFSKKSMATGIKRIPLLGHNNEFEQINNYVQGDEIRKINWKATSRKKELMVNHYQAERSQHVYMVIDKSRAMERSFEGLTLLDYAINSSLVFGNIALRKGEKVGLFTYSDKMGDQLAASKSKGHLKAILELLYSQRTNFKEANFKLLVQTLQRNVRSRSLIMLYTNFETLLGLKRALPLLKLISKQHVLVVIFFENTQLHELAIKRPTQFEDIYASNIAQQQMHIKHEMAKLLKANGIYTVLTQPQDLHINTINSYLSLKSRGVV